MMKYLYLSIAMTALTLVPTEVASVSADLSAEFEPRTSVDSVTSRPIRELGNPQSDVLNQAELASRIAANKLPWYYFYEKGVKALKADAASEAITALQMAVLLKPESAREVRMYGMWFVDYLPYFYLSMAFKESGDLDLAGQAIVLSETAGEFAPADPGYEQFVILRESIQKSGLITRDQ